MTGAGGRPRSLEDQIKNFEGRIGALERRLSPRPMPGFVTLFAGGTVPMYFALADGSAVSRTTYAALFAVIGTTYGPGDGSTTFNLPNLTGVGGVDYIIATGPALP